MSLQQMLLGVGGAAKVFLENIFANKEYVGDASSSVTVTNNLDLAGEGGLVIGKRTGSAEDWVWCDTERGTLQYMSSHNNQAPSTSHGFSAYNSNGFTVNSGAIGAVNVTDEFFQSYTFRKQAGFFDIVKWTGNGTQGRSVSHNLGCKPGAIVIRRYEDNSSSAATGDWIFWHDCIDHSTVSTGNKSSYHHKMHDDGAHIDDTMIWRDPTATEFTLDTDQAINADGHKYVAYLWAAGNESTYSLDFDEGDYLSVPDHTDLSPQNTNSVFELWFKQDTAAGTGSSSQTLFSKWKEDGFDREYKLEIQNVSGAQKLVWSHSTNGTSTTTLTSTEAITSGWNHVIIMLQSTVYMYLNGVLQSDTVAKGGTIENTSRALMIGAGEAADGSLEREFDGKMSELRFVKGETMFSTSRGTYKPKSPLTTTSEGQIVTASNTKLLCLNQSSNIGATVSPTTITGPTESSRPVSSVDNTIYGDPECAVFGQSADQTLIKTGIYYGNGNTDGPQVDLGWEPQWILLKKKTDNSNWAIHDNMLGVNPDGSDYFHYPDTNSAVAYSNRIGFLSNGFKIRTTDNNWNSSGYSYMYIAVRAPVGTIVEEITDATKLFNVVTGTAPGGTMYNYATYQASFPVDMAIEKQPASVGNWKLGARVMNTGQLYPNLDNGAGEETDYDWNSWAGCHKSGAGTNSMAWMWRKHPGFFDCVSYYGKGGNLTVPHNLAAVPEMMIIKNIGASGKDWRVYHKDMTTSTNNNAYDSNMKWNTDSVADHSTTIWNSTAPTATNFTVGDASDVNQNGQYFLALLFASKTGVSKVGTYNAPSPIANRVITTGFQPRFVIIRNIDSQENWYMFDSVRGWDSLLRPNIDAAENTGTWISVQSTGFTVTNQNHMALNGDDGHDYIYYAVA